MDFTFYLDVFLPQLIFSPLPCEPRELFLIRRTLFKLLKENNYQLLYAPDKKYYDHHDRDDDQYEKWKKNFLDTSLQDKKNRNCPSLFYLAENFLSIVAKVLDGKTNLYNRILFLFAKSGAVKKEEIPYYESYIKENHYDRCWVIADVVLLNQKILCNVLKNQQMIVILPFQQMQPINLKFAGFLIKNLKVIGQKIYMFINIIY